MKMHTKQNSFATMKLLLLCLLCACLLRTSLAAKVDVFGEAKGAFEVATEEQPQLSVPGADGGSNQRRAAIAPPAVADVASRDESAQGQLPMVGEMVMDYGPPELAPGAAARLAQAAGVDPRTGLSPDEAVLPPTLPSEGIPNDILATSSAEGSSRKLLQRRNLLQGGSGVWYFATTDGVNPASTGIVIIHANLLADGRVFELQQGTPQSGVFDTVTYANSLASMGGASGGPDPFCGGNILTPEGRVVDFGGHFANVNLIRDWDPATGATQVQPLYANRWYPTPTTMPNGAIMIVGGSSFVGASGYCGATSGGGSNQQNQALCPGGFGQLDANQYNTPTYQYYNSQTRQVSVAYTDMLQQLSDCWPICSYPYVIVIPPGKVVVMAGKTTATYQISDTAWPVTLSQRLPDRPGVPWTYPQTGTAVLLPLDPATGYRAEVLSLGGNAQDFAGSNTPATADAFRINLSAGSPTWVAQPMPQARVMPSAVLMPDGNVLVVNGGGYGTGGYGTGLGAGNSRDPVLQPVIYYSRTGTWSAPLAAASQPRLYHSAAFLLPTAEVMVSGSEVTNDYTAEKFRPPYLLGNNQPLITSPTVPQSLGFGQEITLQWSRRNAAQPVDYAVVVKAQSMTHSVHFDQRLVILATVSKSSVTTSQVGADTIRSASIRVTMPPNGAVAPPGLYMLFLLTSNGVPSRALYVSIAAELPGSLPSVPQPGPGYTVLEGKDYYGNDFFQFYCGVAACANYVDCATYCLNTVGCAAWTWNTNTCYLKSAAVGPVDAAPGTYTGAVANPLGGGGPPPPPSGPFTLVANQDQAGNDYEDFPCTGGGCASAADCGGICTARYPCKAFTLNGGRCYLKYLTRVPVAVTGATTGSPNTPKPVPTIPAGAFYTATFGEDQPQNDIANRPCYFGVAGCQTYEDCAGFCRDNPACVAWSLSYNTCWLKDRAVTPVDNPRVWTGTITSRTGAPPGPPSGPYTLVANQDQAGNDYEDFPCTGGGCASAADCGSICTARYPCKAFTLNGGRCYLKYLTRVPPVAVTGATTGSPNTPVPPPSIPADAFYTATFGEDQPQNDIANRPCYFGVAGCQNYEDCAGICRDNPACVAWSLSYNTCWLKNGATTPVSNPRVWTGTIKARTGAPPGPPTGSGDFTLQAGRDQEGNDYEDFPCNGGGCTSASDCGRICAANYPCKAFAANGPRCYLKYAAKPFEIKPEATTGNPTSPQLAPALPDTSPYTATFGQDQPAADIANRPCYFGLAGCQNYRDCAGICIDNPACAAWSLSYNTCWLKNRATTLVSNPRVWTGTIKARIGTAGK